METSDIVKEFKKATTKWEKLIEIFPDGESERCENAATVIIALLPAYLDWVARHGRRTELEEAYKWTTQFSNGLAETAGLLCKRLSDVIYATMYTPLKATTENAELVAKYYNAIGDSEQSERILLAQKAIAEAKPFPNWSSLKPLMKWEAQRKAKARKREELLNCGYSSQVVDGIIKLLENEKYFDGVEIPQPKIWLGFSTASETEALQRFDALRRVYNHHLLAPTAKTVKGYIHLVNIAYAEAPPYTGFGDYARPSSTENGLEYSTPTGNSYFSINRSGKFWWVEWCHIEDPFRWTGYVYEIMNLNWVQK